MTESATQKTRSSFEAGVVVVVGIFLITLAFDAGIQYSQISALNTRTDSNTAQIQAIQSSNSTNGAILAHIQTMVEDMRASEELRKTGAMR
jgi:hypothetical protein